MKRHAIWSFLVVAFLAAIYAIGDVTTVNVGSSPNDGTGDTLRVAMQKLNTNDLSLSRAMISNMSGFGTNTSLQAAAGGSVIVQSVANPFLFFALNDDGLGFGGLNSDAADGPITHDTTDGASNIRRATWLESAPAISNSLVAINFMKILTMTPKLTTGTTVGEEPAYVMTNSSKEFVLPDATTHAGQFRLLVNGYGTTGTTIAYGSAPPGSPGANGFLVYHNGAFTNYLLTSSGSAALVWAVGTNWHVFAFQ